MSQDFLSSGMARAHGYESFFALHAVRGRLRVFEHLLQNAPFVADRSRVLTMPVSLSFWGDGSSAMGRRALGAVIGVVVAAGEPPLAAWREQGADKHFFGGVHAALRRRFDTETWETVLGFDRHCVGLWGVESLSQTEGSPIA